MTRVLVVGAGVAGLCAAHELSRRGREVVLLDRAAGPGPQMCSWWAGGMLAPFCEAATAGEPVLRLGREAADWWQAAGVEVTRRGTLVVAPGRDAGEVRRFARLTRGFREAGPEEVAELEPDLAGRFPSALFFPEEAHLDPRAALAALEAGLRARGVERRTPDAAPAADLTLDCRGLAARDALPDLRGVRGEMAVLRCPEVSLSRPVRLLHPRAPIYVVPRGEGVYMVGATMIESEARGPATARSLMELLGAAYALHPAFAEAEILEIGADARPAFPDNLPRLRRAGGRLHLNGLYRHGFLLAPALARMAAEVVEDGGHVPELMDEDRAERTRL
ncbi:MAG: FAD-dependent oxidoreductase [Pseudomonadota bacterium]